MRRSLLTSLAGMLAFSVACSFTAVAQDAGKGHEKPAAGHQNHDHAKDGHGKKDEGKKDAGKKDETAAKGAEVGKAAPDFTLKGTDGKTYKLSDFKDKVVVLEWTNRECPVCQGLESKTKETAAAVQKKGVVWLSIDSTAAHSLTDNTEHAKKAGLSYPILDDAAGTVGRAYGAKVTPTVYIINKGTVAYVGALVPKGDETRNYVTETVDQILAGKPVETTTSPAYGCNVHYKKD